MKNDIPFKTTLQNSLGPWIGKTQKILGIHMRKTFQEADIDLTQEQFAMLMTLNEEDGLNQTDLAFITERNKGSLARLITGLEKRNLVARISSPEDKRVNTIHLTRQGKEMIEKLKPLATKAISRMQNGIDPKSLEITMNTLKKVQENILKEI